jgi:hypothetical protein
MVNEVAAIAYELRFWLKTLRAVSSDQGLLNFYNLSFTLQHNIANRIVTTGKHRSIPFVI